MSVYFPQVSSNIIAEKLFTQPIVYGMGGDGYFEDGNLDPFRLTSSADGSFGSEVQVYNGNLGPCCYVILDRLLVIEMQRADETYLVEAWAGSTTFANATRIVSSGPRFASTKYGGTGQIASGSPLIKGDLKIWARVKCTYSSSSSWIDLLVEGRRSIDPTQIDE